MAFVNSALSVTVAPVRASSKVCSLRGSRAVAPSSRRASVAVVRMSDAPDYPSSDVLGLGKDVPSNLYALASAPAFVLGCWSIYQSNIAQSLSAGNVNAQFIVGSLLVPISWGLHVAAFIQKENGK